MAQSSAKLSQLAAGKETLLDRFIAHAKGPNGLASITKELAYAVHDIRQKVVEEGMYGRTTTPQHMTSIHGEAIDAGKGDPLRRAAAVDAFRDLCREAHANHPRERPEIGDRGPDR